VDTGLLGAMAFHNVEGNGHLLENLVFIYLCGSGYEMENVNTGEGG
jgi:hypothetical protein